MGERKYKLWIARILITVVFAINVFSALQFIFVPEQFLGAYELEGISGTYVLQGIGIVFLMWNATYPAVIVQPQRFRALFVVMLVQQLIGLAGESALLAMLPAGHLSLFSSTVRFIVFDSLNFILLVVAFILSRKPARINSSHVASDQKSVDDGEQVTRSGAEQLSDEDFLGKP